MIHWGAAVFFAKKKKKAKDGGEKNDKVSG